jgi:hypothetical protein
MRLDERNDLPDAGFDLVVSGAAAIGKPRLEARRRGLSASSLGRSQSMQCRLPAATKANRPHTDRTWPDAFCGNAQQESWRGSPQSAHEAREDRRCIAV